MFKYRYVNGICWSEKFNSSAHCTGDAEPELFCVRPTKILLQPAVTRLSTLFIAMPVPMKVQLCNTHSCSEFHTLENNSQKHMTIS